MTAHYRVGNGRSGNIRAHEIHHVVTNAVAAGGIRRVVNPFAAVGGIDPEDLEEVRLLAPTSALATAQRCVIADDYALVASEFPDVLAASATIFHGIGGRQQVRITVQPQPRVDFEQLCGRVVRRLEGLRLIGHDVSVSAPIYADVEIDLAVELSPPDSADSSGAQAAILRLKAVFDSADGSGGYFAPTMFTLGEPLRLADVLLTAQHVPGVRTARIDRLVVRGQLKQASALEVVAVGSDEIIRLVGSNDAQGRATIGVSIGCPL